MSEKPTVVLLPGLDGTGRLFGWLIRELEAHAQARVISYPPERFLGYPELADLVRSQAPAGPYAIVAESFSGPVAVTVGATKPAGLRGIILSASFVVPPAPRLLRVVPFELFIRLGIPKTLLHYFLLDSLSTMEIGPELALAIASVAPSVLGARIREVLGSNTSDSLRSCAAPVVFLVAGSDRLLGSRAVRAACRAHPGVESIMIEGPHLLLQARPVESGAVIRSCLQRWFAT